MGFTASADTDGLNVPRSQAVLVARSIGPRRRVLLYGGGRYSGILGDVLRSGGSDVYSAHAGSQYRRTGTVEFELPLDNSAAQARLLQELMSDGKPLDSVVYLGHLEELSVAGADEALAPGVAARQLTAEVLAALQAVVRQNGRAPQLWLVTRGAQFVLREDDLDLVGGALWGFGRGVDLEHPEVRCRCVDLPDTFGGAELDQLGDLITNGCDEPNLAFRQGAPYALRLRPSASSRSHVANSEISLNPEASYLVTGAFGGLGKVVAQWLAERGARELFLVGRSGPGPEAQALIARLLQRGVRVHALRADLAAENAVRDVFRRIAESGRPLGGILHVAGAVADSVILQQTPEHFNRAFSPKIDAAWLLHQFSSGHKLDFFVLFGSAASVLGSTAQVNHAAANALLDSLAFYRRRQGLPATTISWGPWSEVGAAVKATDQGRAMARGVGAISPAQGIDLLGRIMAGHLAQVAVLPIDWSRYLAPSSPHARWSLLEDLARAVDADRPEHRPVTEDAAAQLIALPPRERLLALKEHLRKRLANVLRMHQADSLRDDQVLLEVGLDSLMALELKNELQSSFGVVLPATMFFEYPTLSAVSSFLSVALIGRQTIAPNAQAAYEQFAI